MTSFVVEKADRFLGGSWLVGLFCNNSVVRRTYFSPLWVGERRGRQVIDAAVCLDADAAMRHDSYVLGWDGSMARLVYVWKNQESFKRFCVLGYSTPRTSPPARRVCYFLHDFIRRVYSLRVHLHHGGRPECVRKSAGRTRHTPDRYGWRMSIISRGWRK